MTNATGKITTSIINTRVNNAEKLERSFLWKILIENQLLRGVKITAKAIARRKGVRNGRNIQNAKALMMISSMAKKELLDRFFFVITTN